MHNQSNQRKRSFSTRRSHYFYARFFLHNLLNLTIPALKYNFLRKSKINLPLHLLLFLFITLTLTFCQMSFINFPLFCQLFFKTLLLSLLKAESLLLFISIEIKLTCLVLSASFLSGLLFGHVLFEEFSLLFEVGLSGLVFSFLCGLSSIGVASDLDLVDFALSAEILILLGY